MIFPLFKLKWTTDYQKQFEEIFFTSSSRKNFESNEEKSRFFRSWTSYYFTHCPDEVYFYIESESKRILGYLTGCSSSDLALVYHKSLRQNETLFTDLFVDYPAHLHINCHADARGKGIGSKLIDTYLSNLAQEGVSGVHIVTSPDSRNVGFYKKNGFDFLVERTWEGRPLLFMGRRLLASKSKYHLAPSLER